MVDRESIVDALYGESQMTQKEASEFLGISRRKLRKLMVDFEIPSRTKVDARKLGNASRHEAPSVTMLPEIISDLDAMENPPTTLEEAEQYIKDRLWREQELEVSFDSRSSKSITPHMIVAVVKAKKWRDEE